MLRTVLLLDGSEAMNSASDYLPSYLLASRAPVMRFVNDYLEFTPLALLGVVVMRDGVSRRLASCTANAQELMDTLERDYFLHGGSGATSLENGLRMALSEVVDLKRVLKRNSKARARQPPSSSSSSAIRVRDAAAVRPRIVVLSAAVTLVDPTDVLRVVRVLANFGVVVDIVSFVGAVHVFEECTRQTGGVLCCPLNYDHLLGLAHQLAIGTEDTKEGGTLLRLRRQRQHQQQHTMGSGNGDRENEQGRVAMLPIGFPIYLTDTASQQQQQQQQHEQHLSVAEEDEEAAGVMRYHYLACPRCHLVQTAIPTTCSLCKLLLCSVPTMYSTFVAHNRLLPPCVSLSEGGKRRSAANAADAEEQQQQVSSAETNTKAAQQPQQDEDEAAAHGPACGLRCALCMEWCQAGADGPAGSPAWRCEGCHGVCCEVCHAFVTDRLQLCPSCVALAP